VARTVKLAQAGMSRLCEIRRGSPKYLSTNGRPGEPLFFLSEQTSRLGEGSSRLSEGPPRLGETLLPERNAGREGGWL